MIKILKWILSKIGIIKQPTSPIITIVGCPSCSLNGICTIKELCESSFMKYNEPDDAGICAAMFCANDKTLDDPVNFIRCDDEEIKTMAISYARLEHARIILAREENDDI